MSRKRMPSVGKSLISRIFARSSAISITALDLTRKPRDHATGKRWRERLLETGAALVQEGLHRLLRLRRRVRLRERVDAVLDGGAQVGVAPADDQVLLEPDRGGRALEDAVEQPFGDRGQLA